MSVPAGPSLEKAWSGGFACVSCRRPYPTESLVYLCPTCGGLYDFQEPLSYRADSRGTERRRDLARHAPVADLLGPAPLISLGEGNTPLLRYRVRGRDVFFKADFLNPTGSFKDRGTAVLVSWLKAAGVEEAIEDSSGNAGASFAAYAARAGIKARVYVPDYASGPKRAQIEAYGAELVRILGPRSETSRAAQRAADAGAVYASHAYLPHGLAGMATLAFEVYEQLGGSPGAFIAPVGHGTLLLGAYRGFAALAASGAIERPPRLIGVQAQACAPLWAVSTGGAAALGWVKEGSTVAEGIRILHPFRGDAVLQAIEQTGGRVIPVEESAILDGRLALSGLGLFVEPTSSVVWPALLSTLDDLPDPVVVALTGSGYKDLRGLELARSRTGGLETEVVRR